MASLLIFLQSLYFIDFPTMFPRLSNRDPVNFNAYIEAQNQAQRVSTFAPAPNQFAYPIPFPMASSAGMVPNTAFAPPASFAFMPSQDPQIQIALSRVPVIASPWEQKIIVDATLDKAAALARPGVPNVVTFGDQHHNRRSISMVEQLFHGVLARNHILGIATVQFEVPSGLESFAEFKMQQVANQIAMTPGGPTAYFNSIPPADVDMAKIFHLMGVAHRMGFSIECFDSPESVTRTDGNAHRNYYMTYRMRNAASRGGGVLTVVGLNHVPPIMGNLLKGTVEPGGPAVYPPLNAVSLNCYAEIPSDGEQMDVFKNITYGLPPSHADFFRFDSSMPNQYFPVPR